jgi:osmotically-inducible protein OsmY
MVVTSRSREVGTPAARIEKDAKRRLLKCSYRPVQLVTCDFHEGILVLRGHVSSFFHKQLAQEAVRDVVGVDKVVNVIEVHD